jgi:MFS family permease
MNRALLLLALCQGLLLTNNVVFIAINGLVGLALAPVAWMATLPVAGYVVGGALSAGLVAHTQRHWGRRRSFQLGLLVAALSAGLCAYAAASRNFPLLVAATVMAGYYNANASLYRFAGPELVAPAFKEKAISLVLAGGILGAFAGPNLANHTKNVMAVPFAASYLALVGVALLGLIAMSFIAFPPHQAPAPGASSGRPLREIARQPLFIVACIGGALGYGVMNLLMAATPIAMQRCGLPFGDAALVLEWHVLAMFVPSFFTGHLIKRMGVLPVMAAGVALNLLCVAIALQGIELMNFLAALVALGIGWNFLYVGGSTLLTATYRPEEKNRAQGAMDFCVFATMAVTSFASGALVTTEGWAWLQRLSLLPIGLMALALVWLGVVQRHPRSPSQG